MSLTIEGATSKVDSFAGNTTTTVTLSSTHANGRAVIFVIGSVRSSISSVSSSTLGAWTLEVGAQLGSGAGSWSAVYYKDFTTALSSEVVTITWPSNASSYDVTHGFCVVDTGNNAVTFDIDSGDSQSHETANSSAPAFHTSTASTLLLSFLRYSSTAAPTAGSGWTGIISGGSGTFSLSQYQLQSSTGTYTPVDGTGGATINAGITMAVKLAGGGGGSTAARRLAVLGVG